MDKSKIDEQLDQYYEERACCGSREERRDFPTFEDWKRDQEEPNWRREAAEHRLQWLQDNEQYHEQMYDD
jgi:hypothetical protein